MISLEWVVWILRGAVLAVPPPAGLVAYAPCRRIARIGEL